MDNIQIKTLESLYHYLYKNPKTSQKKLCSSLNCSQVELVQYISDLNKMGLDIKLDSKMLCLSGAGANEVIDVIKIEEKLKQAQIDKPFHYLFSTASTNQKAGQDKNPSIYLADYQSTGRGRQGKQWLTPLGQSIALSIKHQFNCALKDIAGLNIAMGVAIINTAKKCGNNQLQLKWPNDVLNKKYKVAGILIEASGNKQECTATIGIGINWQVRASLLNKIQQPCMNIEIKQFTRTYFIALLILEIEKILLDFSKNKLKNILPQWQKSDALINKDITIMHGTQQYQGKCLGIDAKGCLLVKHNDETKILSSGEVSIRKVDYFEK